MRRANNSGSVYRMSGKRRNPWAARVSYLDQYDGKRKYKYVGFYPTKKDAQSAVEEFNRDPLALTASQVTFAEVYAEWLKTKNNITLSRIQVLESAFRDCKKLHEIPFGDISIPQMQDAILSRDSASQQQALKTVFVQMTRFAVQKGMLNEAKDLTKYLTAAQIKKGSDIHVPFSQEEIKMLWKNADNPNVVFILLGIYSGTRPGELLQLKTENVDLKNGILRIEGGKNQYAAREIPIHSKVLPLLRALPETEYLIQKPCGKKYPCSSEYKKFRFLPALQAAGIKDHLPHDTRHTFVTRWNAQSLNEIKMRRIIGHTGKGVAESVYTHLTVEDLREELEKFDPEI